MKDYGEKIISYLTQQGVQTNKKFNRKSNQYIIRCAFNKEKSCNCQVYARQIIINNMTKIVIYNVISFHNHIRKTPEILMQLKFRDIPKEIIDKAKELYDLGETSENIFDISFTIWNIK